MIIKRTTKFKRQYKKLPAKFQQQFDERLRIFAVNKTDTRLRIHPLKGKHIGYWSMDVNGDLRALYQQKNDGIVIFCLIGTHRQ